MLLPTPPAKLYYLSGVDQQRKPWVEEILIANKVFFRHRDTLNDPDELRPICNTAASPKQLAEFCKGIVDSRLPRTVPPAKRLLKIQELKNFYGGAVNVQRVMHDILDAVGVLSLTPDPTNELMWGHYGQGHRGIAIEFDTTKGLFNQAQEVTYVDVPVVIDRVLEDYDDTLRKALLTKRSIWAYEREWRVIARWADQRKIERYIQEHQVREELRPFFLAQHGPGHYDIPADAVTRVILGSRASTDTEEWLAALMTKRSHPAQIQMSTRSTGGVSVSHQ